MHVFFAPLDTPPPLDTSSQGSPVTIGEDGVTEWKRLGVTD